MDKDSYAGHARGIAERMAKRMVKAYEATVCKYIDAYEEPPDEEDFFAWLDGYDWADLDQTGVHPNSDAV